VVSSSTVCGRMATPRHEQCQAAHAATTVLVVTSTGEFMQTNVNVPPPHASNPCQHPSTPVLLLCGALVSGSC
jgi:hypothetical protein